MWTFRYGIRAAHTARSRFLEGQARFPKFKARRRDRPRFTVTDGLQLQAGRVRVAQYGWVRLGAPCRAQAKLRRLLARGRARILNITVSRDAGGSWYASVCFERTTTTTPEAYRQPIAGAVGVDVGLKTAAVVATSDGTPAATLEASRAMRRPGPHQAPATRPVPNTERVGERRQGPPAPGPGTRPAVRTYGCEQCDLVIDRDVNAAANLAAWGEQRRGSRPGAGTQAGDRHPAARQLRTLSMPVEGATSRSP